MAHHTSHTKHAQTLPKGMALIATAEGRWFPALAPLTDTPHWVTILDAGARAIPPALASPSHHDPKKGYSSRKQALEACHTWDEEVRLSVHWERIAAHIEAYPERNAWYVDEITHMTGGSPLLVSATIEAVTVVVTESYPGIKVIRASGITVDEAIEQLYQRVHDWWNGLAEVRAS
ncbi:MAG TPA: hypothetical protein VIY29_04370 [Ktedonobacteraceae bacterium]